MYMQTGVTPLLKAAMAGHTEVVEILVDAGSDVNIQDVVSY